MPDEISRRRFGGAPFREVVPLRAMMDHLLESAFTPAFLGAGQAGASGVQGFGMDVDEDDDNVYVSCHLPGIDPN